MNEDFFKWIDANKGEDTARLRLKYGPERALEILQIDCRKRFGTKLKTTLERDPEFIFPTALSGEQSTSDSLAAFHATLIPSDARVIDLTAGLGIDVMALATRAAHVTAIERNETVADSLRHNTRMLDNISVVCADCREWIENFVSEEHHADVVFIDPARRDGDGGRTYSLDSCEPDVTLMLHTIRKAADVLIIKASPMLDITHTLKLLPPVSRVITLGTTTECKELDLMIDFRESPVEPLISAVTVTPDGVSDFSFLRSMEEKATVLYGIPRVGQLILDPYPSVMKAGAMKLLSERFGLKKLAANTHVWFADSLPENFPGRAFIVEEILPYASKHIKRYASRRPRIAVTARNFEITSDILRSKLGVKEGPGRLFAVSDTNGNRFLITTSEVE